MRPNHPESAFTLTDILIILALLSLLAAITVAQQSAARQESRLAICVANLGRVDRALLDYCADNNHQLPGVAADDN